MEDVFIERIKKLPKQTQEKYIAFFRAMQLSEQDKDREADKVFDMKEYRQLAMTSAGILFNNMSADKVLASLCQ